MSDQPQRPQPPRDPNQPFPQQGPTVFRPPAPQGQPQGQPQSGWGPPQGAPQNPPPAQPGWGPPPPPAQPPTGWGPPPGQFPGGPGGPGAPAGKGRGKLVAIIAGAAVLVLLAIAGGVWALTSGGGKSADEVAQQVLEDVYAGEFETYCDAMAPDFKKEQLKEAEVDDCAAYAKKQNESYEKLVGDGLGQRDGCDLDAEGLRDAFDYDIRTGEPKEKGDDRATVDYTATITFSGGDDQAKACLDDESPEPEKEKGTFELRKYDGDWLIESEPKSD